MRESSTAIPIPQRAMATGYSSPWLLQILFPIPQFSFPGHSKKGVLSQFLSTPSLFLTTVAANIIGSGGESARWDQRGSLVWGQIFIWMLLSKRKRHPPSLHKCIFRIVIMGLPCWHLLGFDPNAAWEHWVEQKSRVATSYLLLSFNQKQVNSASDASDKCIM